MKGEGKIGGLAGKPGNVGGRRGWGEAFNIPPSIISRIDLEDRAISRPEQGSWQRSFVDILVSSTSTLKPILVTSFPFSRTPAPTGNDLQS
jgi:hypothetical protein